MKVIYIPLDERPCNYKYPIQIAEGSSLEIIAPPKDILNNKKVPAKLDKLWRFVEEKIEECSYAVLSLDMLIYGGLLPSRLHELPLEVLLERLERIKRLKENNPKVIFYGFDLIMRVPSYSSAEEEPNYYEEYGEFIFKISWLKDKLERGVAEEKDKEDYEKYINYVPKEFQQDYFERRDKNYKVTEHALKMVAKGIFDFYVIPQDDSALYGVQSQEQGKHRKTIENCNIGNKVYMYPGADEVGCTLISRIINHSSNKTPKVFVKFSSTLGPTIIPKYEDRPYLETIKYHIISCGMCLADGSDDADVILMVNTPGTEMTESWCQGNPPSTNNSHRNLKEFVIAIKEYIKTGKKVALADVAYSNGADLELISLLNSEKILDKLCSYGGWNTNGNTLGTVLSAAVVSVYNYININFLIYRLIEDCGYQALVRQQVISELPNKGLSYYDFKDKQSWVEMRTKMLLEGFVNNNIKQSFEGYDIIINKVDFPWKRMFEVDLEVGIIYI